MPRLLVIEDEPSIAENLRLAFTREGFEVVQAGIAAEGVALAREAGCDLVVLDVGLPDKSGFEACKDIRAFSDVPVIFLTARGEEIDRVVGLEIGADDYVVKPFSVRELVARVQAILRRRRAPAAAMGTAETVAVTPAVHGLVHDRERAAISYHGRTLELTRYEYLLLALLLERPGRVWSREAIMARVWDQASPSGDRTVDAHVKSLRAKLRAVDPQTEPLRTHRGLGYSLADAS
ncbi:MAG: two-component system response regulator CreB [Gammaproteobacteria bacterium]|nr:two-component system response regulator CreB [Gammaproteobacteria bacterium]MCP5202145.1 two-component system response regulator CreB [Gammaproteobacteria bacterium]